MRGRFLAFHAGVVAVAVLLDQWIKYLVETRLVMHQPVEILPFLALFRTYNTGIAFSMFSSLSDTALVAIALVVVGFISYLASKTTADQRIARLGFALIVGGAIGNVIDRVAWGHVIDYIYFHTPVWSFAVFNLADMFISVGAALVILEEVLGLRRPKTDRSTD